MDEHPVDPFRGDPSDPARELEQLDEAIEPLSPAERQDVVADLSDLEVFQTLLEPRDVRGLVVDCEDCEEPHYFDWELLQANLRHLLDAGQTRVHEPAFSPDPSRYVSWDYARGFSDAVCAAADSDDVDTDGDTDIESPDGQHDDGRD